MHGQRRHRVLILGAGMSGICMGVRLRQRGITSFLILEKASRVGGTWRENTYPGVACDVPSHLYSFSFDLNPDWSHVFSSGAEIQAYCEACVERHALGEHLLLGTEVSSARFVDDAWRVETSDGRHFEADVVVSALGGLHVPKMPDLPGIENFGGTLFHTARWDHGCDLHGKRVAVIGSGASAVQVVPAIAAATRQLTVFQRQPGWIVPRQDRPYGEAARQRFRRSPLLARLQRWWIYLQLEARGRFVVRGSVLNRLIERQCRAFLEQEIPDPTLRRKLTPDYPPGCKRILISDDYYAALQRENVALETAAITAIERGGVRTGDGRVHAADVIVAATGFRPFDISHSVDVRGRDGVMLRDVWRERIEAHRTMMVSGFPNLFLLLGPNSGLGHNSVILMIEAQVSYVLKSLALLERQRTPWMEPLPEAARRFNDRLQRGLARTVFGAGCGAWYTDEKDQNFTLWPYSTPRYFLSLRHPRRAEFRFAPQQEPGVSEVLPST
jgi:cation diffusion facilitator CzcD-associated flavoprotein CzcO